MKTITIDQLKPGMFIVEMDQPWYRTPFLIHKRLIRHTGDIDRLRQCGVRELKIDPGQGLDLEALPSEEASLPSDTQEEADSQATPAQGASSAETLRPGSETHPTSLLPPSDAAGHALPPTSPQQALTQTHAVTANQPDEARQTDNPARPANPQQPSDTPEATLSSNAEEPVAVPQPNPDGNLNSGTAGQAAQLQPPVLQEVPLPLKASLAAAAAQETYTEAIGSMERMFNELEAGIVPRPDTMRMVVASVLSRIMDDSDSMLSLLFLQKMKRFDRTLASHALDVCTLSLIVARTYGVADEDLELVGAGALLHDIGYIRLPRNLYRNTHALSKQESILMQQHPALGQAILREAKEDRDAIVRIVAEHHERSNGTGFPHNLQGDTLSVLAQLVGLVDTYDGMVSRRGGRPGMLPHDAIRQLFRLGDTGQYAKEMIQSMIGSLGVYPIGSLVQLNTTEQAVVVGMNPTQRLKPIIKVITGAQGGSYLTPIRVDLGAQAAGASARTITKVMDPLQERINVALFLEGIEPEAA